MIHDCSLAKQINILSFITMANSSSEKSNSEKSNEVSIKDTHPENDKTGEHEDSLDASVVQTSEMSEKQSKMTTPSAKERPQTTRNTKNTAVEPMEKSLSLSYYSQGSGSKSTKSSFVSQEQQGSLPKSEDSESTSAKYYKHEWSDSETKEKSDKKRRVTPSKPLAKVVRKPPIATTSNGKSASAQVNPPKVATAGANINKHHERKSKRGSTARSPKTERRPFAAACPGQSTGKPNASLKQKKTKPVTTKQPPIISQVFTSNATPTSIVESPKKAVANADGQNFTNNCQVLGNSVSAAGGPVLSPIIRASRFSKLHHQTNQPLFSQPMLLYWNPAKQGTISPHDQSRMNALLICRVANCVEHVSILTANLRSHSLYIFVDHGVDTAAQANF